MTTEMESWASSSAARKVMKGNRRADTAPEVRLRSVLHAAGLRFFKDRAVNLAAGRIRADIVFPRARVAVFVDGCFWHCCPEHGTMPKTNPEYWAPKLARNVERDRGNDSALMAEGWAVVRIWEHETVPVAAQRVQEAVRLRREL